MIRDNFLDGNQRRCPICGKEFWASREWVYKKGYDHDMKYYCSWTCYRRKTRTTVYDRIAQAFRDGLSDAEIVRVLGVTRKQIERWRDLNGPA